MCQRMKADPLPHTIYKNLLKMGKDQNIKAEIIKFLDKNIDVNLNGDGLGELLKI